MANLKKSSKFPCCLNIQDEFLGVFFSHALGCANVGHLKVKGYVTM